MALKSEANDPLDYLNKLLEENGIEIVLPEDEKKEEEKKTDDKK